MTKKSGVSRIDEKLLPKIFQHLMIFNPNFELFSASSENIFLLSKEEIEHYLDGLTVGRREYEFEYFCRRLAEREICPDIQTYASFAADGDGKVDVKASLAMGETTKHWWVGTARAEPDPWLFVFGVGKRWKIRLKADIDEILSTGFDCGRVYFFTNQLVEVKERLTWEDAFSRYAGISVHIIDRAELADKVYEGNHLELAVTALDIDEIERTATTVRPHTRTVAWAWKKELDELDRQAVNSSRCLGAPYHITEDCLRGAVLARNLLRPPDELERRFAQAELLARDMNYGSQLLRVFHERAWTNFCLFKDYPDFDRLYGEVERRVERSNQVDEAKVLLKLWMLLPAAVVSGEVSPGAVKIENRRKRLVSILKNIESDSARPDDALQARAGLALVKVARALQSKRVKQVESGCLDLTRVIKESVVLESSSSKRVLRVILGFGIWIDSMIVDGFCEKTASIIRRCHRDGEAGDVFAKHDMQKLCH